MFMNTTELTVTSPGDNVPGLESVWSASNYHSAIVMNEIGIYLPPKPSSTKKKIFITRNNLLLISIIAVDAHKILLWMCGSDAHS